MQLIRPLVLLLVLGQYGCSQGRSIPETAVPDSTRPDQPDLRNAEVTIIIRNHHWLDLNVYLVRGSIRERLVTAGGLSTRVVTLPWHRVQGTGTLRLAADPIGQSRGIVAEAVSVRPSSVVEWTIESGLRAAYVSVF